MKSVITALEPNRDEMLLGFTPYRLEIKGEPETRVKVTEIRDITTGKATVRIVAMAAAGTPVQAVSTLDAIARRILPNARVTARLHGSAAFSRFYTTD
jgi:hypothetical protein